MWCSLLVIACGKKDDFEGFVAAGGRAEFVDMAAGSPGTCAAAGQCCPGGIHPTVPGYRSMAAVWHTALAPGTRREAQGAAQARFTAAPSTA